MPGWTIARSTHLAASPEVVWQFMQQPATMEHVCAPLLRFDPVDHPLPQTWSEGTWRVRLRGPLGLPLGWQDIRVSFPEVAPPLQGLRDDGRGTFVRRWVHVMEIAPEGTGTRYTDRGEIAAGWLTPLVWAFAHVFYAHRQRRWRRLLAGVKT